MSMVWGVCNRTR